MQRTAKFIGLILSFLVLLAVLLIMYFYTNSLNTEKERQQLNELQLLVLQNNRWDSLVLRAASGLSDTYDELAEIEKEIERQVENISAFWQSDTHFKALQATIDERLSASARFKAANSALMNSKRYLPTLHHEVRQQVLSQAALTYVDELMGFLFYYPAGDIAEQQETFTERLSKLESLLPQETREASAVIRTFIGHARLLFNNQLFVYEQLEQFNRANIDEAVDLLTVNLDARITEKSTEKARMDLYLLVYSFALLAAGLYFGVKLFLTYRQLNRANDALSQLNLSLEEKVSERTIELNQTLRELKESQVFLVQAEKMSSLGQLVAGIAHEINTPLAYVKSALETIEIHLCLSEFPQFIKNMEAFIKGYNNKEARSAEDIKVLQGHFRSAQKVVEEMGGEIAVIVEEIQDLIKDGIYGADQISELIVNLRNFSRLDRSRVAKYSLTQAINSALLLLKNEIKDKQIIKNIAQDFEIECMPSQINQVLLNIFSNANQAISDGGVINIRLYQYDEDFVAIDIQDNGHGISSQHLSRIFDPFFTTKEIGKGTGLGLSICYKIIQEHGGDILVQSQENQGTVFSILFPLKPHFSKEVYAQEETAKVIESEVGIA